MFRLCLICKVPLLESALCSYCASQLGRLREPSTRDEKIFPVQSLYSWRQLSPPALSWMVRSLKGHDDGQTWREMAVDMLDKFGPLGDAVFVPIPSHSRNHALGFARALAQLTGWPVCEALGLGTHSSTQKNLTRERRLEVHFEREIWSPASEAATTIVVDDVVTTGATIHAAFHALGRPQSFQAWCLLDRRPCAPSRGLL